MQHLHLVIHMKLAIDRLKCVWWTVQAVWDPCVGCSRQFADCQVLRYAAAGGCCQ